MNQTDLISQIRNGEQKGFTKLYNYYPVIKKWLVTNGCPKTDTNDVFQQALLVFCEKCQDENFTLTASIDTYLFSVSKFVFYAKSRKDKKENPTDFSELEIASSNDVDELLQKEEKLNLAFQALAALSERCRTVLQLFYLKKKSMKAIAEQLKFKSEKVAKNQKYKCLKYAKEHALKLEQKIN
ncbi:MAG: RNA polymerase [Bacteroidetes bacterium]|nr:MAG: RNA polymerase [Bacteroidota bacterium]